SLIQTIGRAARNSHGAVIMYADSVTESMQAAIDETARRRKVQMAYNKQHGITPKTIIKPIRDLIAVTKKNDHEGEKDDFVSTDFEDMSKDDQRKLIARLEDEMR